MKTYTSDIVAKPGLGEDGDYGVYENNVLLTTYSTPEQAQMVANECTAYEAKKGE